MKDGRFPDYILERYLLRELPPQQLHALDSLRTQDPDLEARLSRLQDSSRQILAQYPIQETAAAIRARLPLELDDSGGVSRAPWNAGNRVKNRRKKPFSLRSLLIAAPALALAVFVVMITIQRPEDVIPPISVGGGEITRVKGSAPAKAQSPGLFIYRKKSDSGAVERLAPNSKTARGDLLQIAYHAGSAQYGVILSIDGGGAVTLHFPPQPTSSSALRIAGDTSGSGDKRIPPAIFLDAAFELDNAPVFERFFFITSSTPPDVPELLRAARLFAALPAAQKNPLPLGASLKQTSLLLIKGEER